jgi:hypothetical protein
LKLEIQFATKAPSRPALLNLVSVRAASKTVSSLGGLSSRPRVAVFETCDEDDSAKGIAERRPEKELGDVSRRDAWGLVKAPAKISAGQRIT